MVGNDLSVYLYNHFLGKRLDIPSIIMLQDFVGISISKWVVINVFFFFFIIIIINKSFNNNKKLAMLCHDYIWLWLVVILWIRTICNLDLDTYKL